MAKNEKKNKEVKEVTEEVAEQPEKIWTADHTKLVYVEGWRVDAKGKEYYGVAR